MRLDVPHSAQSEPAGRLLVRLSPRFLIHSRWTESPALTVQSARGLLLRSLSVCLKVERMRGLATASINGLRSWLGGRAVRLH